MTATLLETPRTTIASATGLPARVAADTRYVLTGFPLALGGLVLCMTGFVAGVSLAVVWVGVPLMIAAMTLSRVFARAERARIAAVLGKAKAEAEAGQVRQPRHRVAFTDPQAWRDLAHASLRIIPSTVAFSVVVTWWAGVLGGLSWALWGWALPDGQGLPELLGLGDAYLTAVAFYLVAALLFAVTLPVAVHGAARFEARFAQVLLSPAALPEA
ncbi:sensor domain-containing protein [Dactylosporangium cerinum]|uniref:Sensor domain-containing protein n=1 Tax=Dactylosporangium cerinum TaxID=1434730 RepID=A0ABV9VMT5_9ACTN